MGGALLVAGVVVEVVVGVDGWVLVAGEAECWLAFGAFCALFAAGRLELD